MTLSSVLEIPFRLNYKLPQVIRHCFGRGIEEQGAGTPQRGKSTSTFVDHLPHFLHARVSG